MEWTGLNELREQYLQFFEGKGHLRMPSASLVPQGDKSLLLINSGMAPLKKFFTREIMPPSLRVTTCQKCIRTPDIESVGITARHGTYFEMLGNFSFGDYFKKEATAWAWEFFTEVIQMPKELLHITVYEQDDEAFDIWTREVGVEPSHVTRLGKKDNFWEHGSGPCGPCSELQFDRGEQYGCGKPGCAPGCDCDRFMEIWNLVFTQFNSDGNGNYSELALKNIDTGMGLERLACVVQGVDNLFEVDTVQNIMKHIMDITGVRYHEDKKKDISLRVITDHIRSTTFMVGDGVMPSNEGRGYVLRRLLRRAARHGRLLGVERAFLAEVCETVIRENAGAYPNLAEKKEFILKVIRTEEENFMQTIDTGMSLLMQLIDAGDRKLFSGEDAFRLSDTYGFPIDLTREILAERNIEVDTERFFELVKQQRERSRAARTDAGADAWKGNAVNMDGINSTIFMGYETMQTQSCIEAMFVEGERVYTVAPDCEATLVLDQTPFYAESGGQVGDTGVIETADAVFTVHTTTKTPQGIILHHGCLTQGETLEAGATADAMVDEAARSATMRNHTAAHLLQAALKAVLGSHVEQAGQLVGSETMRFDFTHFSALTQKELARVEHWVNEAILQAVAVTVTEMPIEQAKQLGAMALFGEKYGDVVRVVQAGEHSMELCGGTHVHNTGEMGLFKIVGESSVAAGVRRITAVTGYNLLGMAARQEQILLMIAQAVKAGGGLQELHGRVAQVVADLRAKDKEIERLKQELANAKGGDLFGDAIAVQGVQLVSAMLTCAQDELRSYADQIKEKPNYVAVLGAKNPENGSVSLACACSAEAVKAGVHAGKLMKALSARASGSGGGKPDYAMGGSKDFAKAEEAIGAAAEILAEIM